MEQRKKHLLWILFFEFLKIATFVVGGGYAILVIADDVFGRKLKWLKEGELTDMLALIQTVPGLTAGNIAIYIGYRTAGFLGALAALTGVALPSFIIITLIAVCFGTVPVDNEWIRSAFLGVRTAMTGLTLVALARVWKKSLKDAVQCLMFIGGVASILLFHVNPGWIILSGLVLGPLYCLGICRRLPEAAKEESHP